MGLINQHSKARPESSTDTDTKAKTKAKSGVRKGKKAWIKNIDIVDLVEDGLEHARDEERLHG